MEFCSKVESSQSRGMQRYRDLFHGRANFGWGRSPDIAARAKTGGTTSRWGSFHRALCPVPSAPELHLSRVQRYPLDARSVVLQWLHQTSCATTIFLHKGLSERQNPRSSKVVDVQRIGAVEWCSQDQEGQAELAGSILDLNSRPLFGGAAGNLKSLV